MLIITTHAHQRFLERFPDVPVCLTERVEKSLPFGKQSDAEREMYLDPDYDIVYVVAKKFKDKYLITILTKDQALASFARQREMHAWKSCLIDPKKFENKHEDAEEKCKIRIKNELKKIQNELEKLAAEYVVQFNYYFPPKDEKKLITTQIREQHKYTGSAINNYFWPEIGRLIYEYNAKHRSVAADAE